MITRRRCALYIASAVGWPSYSLAQAPPALPVIGLFSSRSLDADTPLLEELHRGLAEAGFQDRRNVWIEYRWAEGRYDALPDLARDLVERRVALLVTTGGTIAARAAQTATATIPIVFTTADDPVRTGLVESLGRPGSNLTGITASFTDAAPKRIALLRELLPGTRSISMLVNPRNPTSQFELPDVLAAAQTADMRVSALRASGDQELESAFAEAAATRSEAMLIASDPFFYDRKGRIVALAAKLEMPMLYFRREFAEVGGLMSYGSDFAEQFRIVGRYAARILNGASPAELPVQQPTHFELVINMATARRLRVEVPPVLLARADRIVE